jgi:hypothetical protein
LQCSQVYRAQALPARSQTSLIHVFSLLCGWAARRVVYSQRWGGMLPAGTSLRAPIKAQRSVIG